MSAVLRSKGMTAKAPVRRCAVYTRKSSEEGLEQDFNSLHAQRDSCEAYIKSQRHEGWMALPTLYDDGGYSGGSFVSVTQQFNTTTSMGRLTLNVLLSFAQFEREVTGERIRDKIAASKRKGIWMGGLVPLGYEVRDRRLVINEAEATIVRHIFMRYCELGSVRRVKQEADRLGLRTKCSTTANGAKRGGRHSSRGALY